MRLALEPPHPVQVIRSETRLKCSAGSPYPALARLLLTQGQERGGTTPGTAAALAPSCQNVKRRPKLTLDRHAKLALTQF